MQIVLNAPFADKENDLSNVIFKPHLELLREKIFFVIADQSELIKATKQPNTILINGMSFASNDPKAIDQNGNRLDHFLRVYLPSRTALVLKREPSPQTSGLVVSK